jgi:pimeloyl-ACP methyl ester carboxylesterase
MTIPQMEQDTLEVASYLRRRFNREKIFVLGVSWGSVLGLWLAHEHPDLIYAYVGVAQVVNLRAGQAIAYQDALKAARDRHIVQAIKDLESIAPDPAADVDVRKGGIAQIWQAKLLGPPEGSVDFLDSWRLVSDLVSAPEYSLGDVFGFVRGQLFSLETLVPQAAKVDLSELGRDFRVPIFFFQGRHDPYSRPSIVQEYSLTINAPRHELVWFETSGHFPFFEDQQRFTDKLVEYLLPLATEAR